MSHLKAHYPNQKLKGAAAEAKCWRWLFIEILLSCPIVARGKSWLDRSSAKRNQFETCCTLIEKVVGQLKRRDNFDHFDWGMIDNFIFTRQQLMLLRDVVSNQNKLLSKQLIVPKRRKQQKRLELPDIKEENSIMLAFLGGQRWWFGSLKLKHDGPVCHVQFQSFVLNNKMTFRTFVIRTSILVFHKFCLSRFKVQITK